MRTSALSRFAFTVTAAAALLPGCGGSQPPFGAPGAMPQGRSIATYAARSGSWMLPEAKSGDLLYLLTDVNLAYVLAYPSGKLQQTLTLAEGSAAGTCSDATGNVFITTWTQFPLAGYIFEYAHGGTTPIATINLGSSAPGGCSVDLADDLAVIEGNGSVANIVVYPGAKDQPTYYTDPAFETYLSTAYDDQGNLFIIGEGPAPSRSFLLAYLAKGTSSFTNVALNTKISGAFVQWDGTYIAITNPAWLQHRGAVVYRVQVSGSTGYLVGTTKFNRLRGRNAGNISLIQGAKIIVNYHQGKLGVWNYPAGGRAIGALKAVSGYRENGITLSLAPH